jgi:hypothetical protein
VRRLTPGTLFGRLHDLIEWAKEEKTALSEGSTGPLDLLPAASFWRDDRPHALVFCRAPEHGDDLTRLVSTGIVHFHSECVCVVLEGENRERGTCVLGFASDGLTIVAARAFYSTVGSVPVFETTDPAPLAVAEFHPFAAGLMTPFDFRSRGEPGDVESLARKLARHEVLEVSTGEVFGPYRE